DADNNIVGWRQRIVNEAYFARILPPDLFAWAAVDAGTAVQPKNIVAQMTSARTFGLGAALKEQIAIKGGVMQASNFDGYPVRRMSEFPPMGGAVVSTKVPPTGIGEAGVPAVGPAIAN